MEVAIVQNHGASDLFTQIRCSGPHKFVTGALPCRSLHDGYILLAEAADLSDGCIQIAARQGLNCHIIAVAEVQRSIVCFHCRKKGILRQRQQDFPGLRGNRKNHFIGDRFKGLLCAAAAQQQCKRHHYTKFSHKNPP